MHLSPRSRSLSKGRAQASEEFVESRLRHLGFPTFGEEEIAGDEADGSMTLEIGYPGLGDDTTESSAPLVADIVGLVGKEMSLGPGKVGSNWLFAFCIHCVCCFCSLTALRSPCF